jgi:aspartyl-tRNA(Asn)/glutamyl-tRNA(Gln) amidotransferase subunit A
MSLPPETLCLAEASRVLAAGTTTARALTEAALARIDALNGQLHPFITVTAQSALAEANSADAEMATGRRRSALHGVPVALKDNIDVAGVPTTAHSRILADNIATRDAHLVTRLRAAGAVFVGKLALHEFARGGPLDVLPWPNARNPWNPDHTCGGSSSGAAVAVAAGMVPMAVGTDTGGSIRYPAGCNSLVGIKPTYGLIGRRGIYPLSFSLDAAGPLTRTVEDCAIALQVLAGHDPADAGSADVEIPDYAGALTTGIAGLRIGYARGYDAQSGVSPTQAQAMDAVAQRLAQLGATVIEIDLPGRPLMDAATWTILLAEGFAVHGRGLREHPQDYGRITRERLSIGAFVTGAHLVQAMRWRRHFISVFDGLLLGCDAILCSTSLGAPVPMAKVDGNPWRHSHPITAPFNLTGHPALAVPAGFDSAGLPLSLQLVGRRFDEATLLRIGHAYETVCDWKQTRPPLDGPGALTTQRERKTHG